MVRTHGSPSRWERFKNTFGFWLGLAGTLLGVYTAWWSVSSGRRTTRESIHRYLDETWRTLGGDQASFVLHNLPRDPSRLYKASQELERAQIHIRRRNRRGELASRAFLYQGMIEQARGRDKDAETSYRKSLEVDSNSSAAHQALGLLLLDTGDVEGARKNLETAATLNPQDAVAQNNFGMVLLVQGEAKEAERVFRSVLEGDPRNPIAHGNLANLYANEGEFEKAIRHIELAISGDWQNAALFRSHGAILYLNDDSRGADAALTRALELGDDTPSTRDLLSVVKRELGEVDGAAREAIMAQQLERAYNRAEADEQ